MLMEMGLQAKNKSICRGIRGGADEDTCFRLHTKYLKDRFDNRSLQMKYVNASLARKNEHIPRFPGSRWSTDEMRDG